MSSKLNGSGVYEMTQQEIEEEADIEAKECGISGRQEAFEKLADGQLGDTALASIFESYKFLLEVNDND